MKKILIATLLISASYNLMAQTVTYIGAPDPIPDNDPLTPLCTGVTMPGSATVSSANFLGIEIVADHTWLGDLEITLESPSGTNLIVVNGAASSTQLSINYPTTFSDTATVGANLWGESPNNCVSSDINGDPAAPCTTTNFIPNQPFAGFNGEPAAGIWILCIGDGANGDSGTLRSWSLIGDGSLPVDLQNFSVD